MGLHANLTGNDIHETVLEILTNTPTILGTIASKAGVLVLDNTGGLWKANSTASGDWSQPFAAGGGGGGITQLTGDVTAGPGSGSQATTCHAVNGIGITVGMALNSGNVPIALDGSTARWGAIDLSNGNSVQNTLAANNGGTGLSSPGTSGNVLTSNGSVWVSSPAPSPAPSSGSLFTAQITNSTPSSTLYGLSGFQTSAYPGWPLSSVPLSFGGTLTSFAAYNIGNVMGTSVVVNVYKNGTAVSTINFSAPTGSLTDLNAGVISVPFSAGDHLTFGVSEGMMVSGATFNMSASIQ